MKFGSRVVVSFVVGAGLIGVAAMTGNFLGGSVERREQIRRLAADVEMRSQLLRSEIERHRLLPTTLASNPELSAAVDAAGSAPSRERIIRRLNENFEQLAEADGAATLYLIDQSGITRVASNHRFATSFVGQDYSFRSYFRDAMSQGTGELFAQGTVSGVPGLYLARRISSGRGVIVTKIEFGGLEESWRQGNDETLVVDSGGQILLTSNSARRFDTYDPGERLADTVIASQLKTAADWTLIILRDIREPIMVARLSGAIIGGLSGLLAALGLLYSYTLRTRRDRQRQELEQTVAQRTAELRASNDKLRHEIDERARTETKVQRLREDLAQANRLAILGQISAGVAHEINQPAAAIRAYVSNIQRMLELGDHVEAVKTLRTVDSLTERIGIITNELREFSRRAPTTKEVVMLSEVIDGARLLLEPLLRAQKVALRRPSAKETQRVHVNRTRLEQVIVNLLQNAVDALADTPSPTIVIDTGIDDWSVWLTVTDNGPGVPAERRADLFAAFSSSKPLGLGLGLVICRDIVADYGGSIEFIPTVERGASFILRLPAWND